MSAKDMFCRSIIGLPVVRYRKIEYFNIPASFDIETSSFYQDGEKVASMYIWMMGVNGQVIHGRTWEEFLTICEALRNYLHLGAYKHLVIYVHNLAYEFQFIRHLFDWDNVFSLRERKPVYAVTTTGIEFRCSYLLSGYSLDKLGGQLLKYKVQKKVGDLDYSKLRNSDTILTDREKLYCENDVRVVMSYIQERIEEEGGIHKIPLTKTGYVRRTCRNACFYNGNEPRSDAGKKTFYDYRALMHILQMKPEEYKQLKRAFQGGFTHANAHRAGRVWENVSSYDFASSYPAVMLSERFPMSTAQEIRITSQAQFEQNLNDYCCLFEAQFINIEEKEDVPDHYISYYRCIDVKDPTLDNGRIVKASTLLITLTEQDYFIIKKTYTWDEVLVGNFRRYQKNYLPKPILETILDLYEAKTKFKGVLGKELEYQNSKEQINSLYGMCVTDPCRPKIGYMDGWDSEFDRSPEIDIDTMIAAHNKSRSRFLFYPIGVWVTAYARRNLWHGILEFGQDYIYSDTDSVKALNADRHQGFIDSYNKQFDEKLYKAMAWNELDFSRTRPKTIKGIEKPIGHWDLDDQYTQFKTLGAKRYAFVDADGFNITVSGLNKKVAAPYILKLAGGDINKAFDIFNDQLYVPPGSTGKKTHTYIDIEREGYIKDYQGHIAPYHEWSFVHLEEADYSLSLTREYADFIRGLQFIDG